MREWTSPILQEHSRGVHILIARIVYAAVRIKIFVWSLLKYNIGVTEMRSNCSIIIVTPENTIPEREFDLNI